MCKAFNIGKNPKFDKNQMDLSWMVYKFFDKITSGRAIKNEYMSNKVLAKELHRYIIR